MNPLEARKRRARRRASLQWARHAARAYDVLFLKGALSKAARRADVDHMIEIPERFTLGERTPPHVLAADRLSEKPRHGPHPDVRVTRVLVGRGRFTLLGAAFFNCDVDIAGQLDGGHSFFEHCSLKTVSKP